MSLASVYAANQSTANTSSPPTFGGANGTLSVTPDGQMQITGPNNLSITMPATAALAAAAWINATFS